MAGARVPFRNREAEREALEDLVRRVRGGEGAALVLSGEPGIGKTALLDVAIAAATDCQVSRVAALQSEMQMAFAGLHQLCAPMLDRLDELPAPQRAALGAAFGLSAGAVADPLLIGLGVLGLVSAAAQDGPLLCVVDDAQWLDHASAQALGFVARRLGAEPVAVMIGVRTPVSDNWSGLPQLELQGLGAGDARALLQSVIAGPIDDRVQDRIVRETAGNPLALLELPRGLRPIELAGGFGQPGAGSLSRRIERRFLRRVAELPPDTRRLLLLAAADPVSERSLVLRAAGALGLRADAADAAEAAGLCEFGTWVRFRHPLVRSAIYGGATEAARRGAHAALGDATDPRSAPDRRAWHRAQAALGPDEGIAADLERSAERARARGGVTATAAFLERATDLTPEPAPRAARALAAAQASFEAGAQDAALRLLVVAETGPLDELPAANVDLLRARIALAQRRGRDAPGLLVAAARRLQPLDAELARDAYLEALAAANLVGRLAGDHGLVEVAEAARAAPAPLEPDDAVGLLLDGLVRVLVDGPETGIPVVQAALRRFDDEELSPADAIRWLWFASHVALCIWDYETHIRFAERLLAIAREIGAFAVVTTALYTRIGAYMGAGDLDGAAALLDESEAVAAATGTSPADYVGLAHAALRGRKRDVLSSLRSVADELTERGEGIGLATVQWAEAVLCNALGRHRDALNAIRGAGDRQEELWFSGWGSLELVEAAARTGELELARTAVERMARTTQACGTDLALGVEARGRALVDGGPGAERWHLESIERLDRTSVRIERARARLLHGEWLRAQGRPKEARDPLRDAAEMFMAMGAEAFAARATRELRAAGESARARRRTQTADRLTAQEARIAQLAREGLTNPDIGARLVVSPRTVEYHLHKVFAKLGISSRRELETALAAECPQ
jgi:DNA-binding CsgD family transcriptional regulator